ncbi:MAG: AmmeMemoRadiSam system protein B [Candidatus Sumerlaeia bacterium]|nr:AmmeMemoRadiSam system protein B [Candidatus Sumerlaeia bacterium]
MFWTPELERPRLRPVEARPVQVHEETMVALSDPLGLAEDGIAVTLPVFFLLTQMNGVNSVEIIAAEFQRQFGEAIPIEKLRQIILQLDQARLFEGETLRRHRDATLAAYRAAPARPMAHAGSGYPREAQAFLESMRAHFLSKGGPGRAPSPGSGPAVRALIAPHIDFDRGGPNYGWSYQALGDGPPPETVVILGTAHAPCGQPFTLTRVSFTTPQGVLPVEAGFIDAVAARAGLDLFDDELLHLREHSVEFQAAALHALFPGAASMRIVPILCGSLHAEIAAGGLRPGSATDRAIRALTDTIASWPRQVTVIAGADLAHMGPHFGDEAPVDEAVLASLHRQDHEAMTLAAAGNADGFLRSFVPTQNARRVCSVACIYTALRCLPALGVSRGRLLNYMQSVHPGGELVVTHASVVFP